LIKLSKYFNLSIDYIVGNIDVPLTLDEVEFIHVVDRMDDKELMIKFNMTMDGEKVSIEELKEMLEKIRALKA
jgi:hypothetical protein